MKNICFLLLAVTLTASSVDKVSTTAGVCLSGAVIKASSTDVSVKKYKRKDCPVCKGKGWYISGDGIAKVDCGYCEPEQEQISEEHESKDSCKTEIISG